MNMSKQGGLDTLAALCGGASKARTNDDNEKATTSSVVEQANSKAPSSNSDSVHNNIAPQPTPAPTQQLPMTTATGQYSSPPALGSVPIDPSMMQQWQSLVSGHNGGSNPGATAVFASLLQAAVRSPMNYQQQQQPQSSQPIADHNAFSAMQQAAYYQYLAAVQHMQHQMKNISTASPGSSPQPTFTVDLNNVTARAFPTHTTTNHFQFASDCPNPANNRVNAASQQSAASSAQQPIIQSAMQQIIPGPPTNGAAATKQVASAQNSSMQPPLPPSQGSALKSALSTNSVVNSPSPQRPIAPLTTKSMISPAPTAIAQRPPMDGQTRMTMAPPRDEKKQQKRAANRRSAQLSRKRKKQFIEELKEENDELRRKEQILMSIPDLIVVFDSAGKLGFVSQSVGRFINFSPRELEGSSFWERLCEESVRLLKAAFMDALAARKMDMDTAPLGSGVWELRLVDKDGSHKVITLNGVVHFSGDYPECVCSIRPRDNKALKEAASPSTAQATETATYATSALSIRTTIKPHQSVIACGSDGDVTGGLAQGNAPAIKANGRRAAQISDGDSGSIISESSSD